MEFENRNSQFPKRRKLTKYDTNNNQIGDPIYVDIERDEIAEGTIYEAGTPINADNLNAITTDILDVINNIVYYKHTIMLQITRTNSTYDGRAVAEIIDRDPTEYDYTRLLAYLNKSALNGKRNILILSGAYGVSNATYPVIRIFTTTSGTINVTQVTSAGLQSDLIATFSVTSDTVLPIN